MRTVDAILADILSAIRPFAAELHATGVTAGEDIGYRKAMEAMGEFLVRNQETEPSNPRMPVLGPLASVEAVRSGAPMDIVYSPNGGPGLTLNSRATPGSVKPVILDYVRAHPGVTMGELKNSVGVKPNSVRGTVWTLQKDGLIAKQGRGFAIVSDPAPAGNGNPGSGEPGQDNR